LVVLLGKKSGKLFPSRLKLEELSLTLPDEKVAALLKEVKEQSETHKTTRIG